MKVLWIVLGVVAFIIISLAVLTLWCAVKLSSDYDDMVGYDEQGGNGHG